MNGFDISNLWHCGSALAVAALAFEGCLGYSKVLYAKIGHPVTWIGAVITWADTHVNLPHLSPWTRACLGAVCGIMLIILVTLVASLISALIPNTLLGFLSEALVASSLIASRSLYEHVYAVKVPLLGGDLAAARVAVAQIVGRDTSVLDDSGVARAALESLAENSSDGIVAPLFWCALLGLPGLAAYKAINTLDSMIGHRTPKHESFGGFSARLDDVVNWLPARLTGLAFALVSPRQLSAIKIMIRDARGHRSPNAGWPETALAACLDVRLSGPRIYEGCLHQEPWLNQGGRDAVAADIGLGLAHYVRMLRFIGLSLCVVAIGAAYG